MSLDPKLQIALVGATGVVGRELLAALQERGHPAEKLTVLGSERAEGEELDYLDETVQVERVEADSFRKMQLVFLATPAEVSRKLALEAQQAGAWVVDTSGAFRAQPEVPLVLPGVNDAVLRAPFKGRVVTCPTPVVTALASALEPLRQGTGVQKAFVTALEGAARAGKRGVDELEKHTAGLLSGKELTAEAFPQRLAFNLIPQLGAFGEGGWTAEEASWMAEARRLWAADPGAPTVVGTGIQVPLFYGSFLSVAAQLRAPAQVDDVWQRWRSSKALKVLDSPAESVYPMPMLVTADPTVHVGRLRVAPEASEWITFVAAVDNAGRGAALTAVEIGEALIRR